MICLRTLPPGSKWIKIAKITAKYRQQYFQIQRFQLLFIITIQEMHAITWQTCILTDTTQYKYYLSVHRIVLLGHQYLHLSLIDCSLDLLLLLPVIAIVHLLFNVFFLSNVSANFAFFSAQFSYVYKKLNRERYRKKFTNN